MAEIIDLKKYKKQHDIPLPNSPYYTLCATKEQIHAALKRASGWLKDKQFSQSYAVLVGYTNRKTGKTKLLKQQMIFPTKEVFEHSAGIRDHSILALTRRQRSSRTDTL